MKERKVLYKLYFPKKLALIFVFILQFSSLIPNAKSQTANEYALKSAFLLHVANFVDWPESSKVNDKTNEFIICIYGDNPFDNTLKEVIATKKKKIKGKIIKVQVIHSVDEIQNADILFISSSEKYNLSKVLKQAENYSILTIGDTKGFVERGVMINTFISESYLKFDVNMTAFKKANFYISSKLLSRAKRVIGQ